MDLRILYIITYGNRDLGEEITWQKYNEAGFVLNKQTIDPWKILGGVT